MDREELKKTIRNYLKENKSLSDIQKILDSQYNEKMTFLELRLLASELENFDWGKLSGAIEGKSEKKSSKKESATAANPKKTSMDIENNDLDGDKSDDDVIPSDKGHWEQATIVEVNKIARPGAMLSGSVVFSSGVKADWVLDQFGRLGLEKATGKPTPEDIKQFQMELQKKLSG